MAENGAGAVNIIIGHHQLFALECCSSTSTQAGGFYRADNGGGTEILRASWRCFCSGFYLALFLEDIVHLLGVGTPITGDQRLFIFSSRLAYLS